MKFDELIRIVPEGAGAAAARARKRALSRLDAEPFTRQHWHWRPAAVLAGLCLVAATLISGGASEKVARPGEPSQQPLRVQMKLSDGTRVEWTFHEGFRL
jgi:hypothetical protein